ncbi:hypothetical protein D9757_012257 [Collybiopsis confluens]|uniref:Protein kinase domain-containing protein n=1 Tax=Collybiopsis confluens TaxID=2823264 RepID=A0A8H5G5B5_9AGAR|nr:hypothetical protein D9757_012257 [Collybiopsis confluens]
MAGGLAKPVSLANPIFKSVSIAMPRRVVNLGQEQLGVIPYFDHSTSFPHQLVPTKRKAAQAVQGETKGQNAKQKSKAKDDEDNSDESDDSDPFAGKKFSLVCTDGQNAISLWKALSTKQMGSLVEALRWEGKKFVVKFSFPSETRDPEDALVNHARNIAKGGHAWATNHLPLLYDCLTVPFGPGTVQYRLKEFFNKRKKSYEVRVLRITISEELCSLNDLKTPEEAAQVFYDILQGKSSSYTGFLYLTLAVVHRWLYTEANILHRDLSMGNIMFRRVGGKVYGVLNDFDLSSFLPLRDEPSSKWRTGTRPYMSRDLLAEGWCGGPLYRHDLESLFYIMLILCCHYKSPDKALPFKDWPYKMWFTSDDATVAERKSTSFGPSPPFPSNPTSSAFESGWLPSTAVSLSDIRIGIISGCWGTPSTTKSRRHWPGT